MLTFGTHFKYKVVDINKHIKIKCEMNIRTMSGIIVRYSFKTVRDNVRILVWYGFIMSKCIKIADTKVL